MPVFAYRALTAAGHGRRGVIDAESARAAWQALRNRGVFPTELAEERATRRAARRGVAAAELAGATRALATLVAAGVPVTEALAAVGEETEQPALANAFTHAHARLREGVPLADALGASPAVFAPLFCDVVRAGEASGALPAVLLRLADHAEATAATRANLAGRTSATTAWSSSWSAATCASSSATSTPRPGRTARSGWTCAGCAMPAARKPRSPSC